MSTNEIIAKLLEIREACAAAMSMEDTNINAIIEEIDRLAKSILGDLETHN